MGHLLHQAALSPCSAAEILMRLNSADLLLRIMCLVVNRYMWPDIREAIVA